MKKFNFAIVFEDGTSANGSKHADTKKEVYQKIIDSPPNSSESMISITVIEEKEV